MDPRLANRAASNSNGPHKRRPSEQPSEHERHKIPRLDQERPVTTPLPPTYSPMSNNGSSHASPDSREHGSNSLRRGRQPGERVPPGPSGGFKSNSGSSTPVNRAMGSPLSRSDVADNEPSPKLISAIVDILKEHATSMSHVVKQEIVKDHAEARLAQAKNDYDSVASHFNAFPHMREKHTASRTTAENLVKAAKVELSARRISQEKLTQQLAQAMFQLQKPKQAQETDHELKAIIQSLQDDRKRDRETIEAMDKKIKSMTVVTEQMRDLQSLPGRTDHLTKDVGDIQKRFVEVEPAIIKNERLIVKLQDIQDQRNKLNDKINERASREIAELKGEIETIRSFGEPRDTNDIIREQVQAIESTLEDIASRLKIGEGKITYVDETLIPQTHIIFGNQIEQNEANFKAEIARISKDFEDVKANNQEGIFKPDTTAFTFALKEVEQKIDSIQEEMVDFTSSNKAVFDRVFKDLEDKLKAKADRKDLAKALEKLPPSTSPPQFVAPTASSLSNVSNPNGGAVSGARDLQDVMKKIDQQGHWLNRLQNQYNNVTTEHVVAQMISQLGELYPDVKTLSQAQAAIAALRHDMDVLSQSVSAFMHNSSRGVE